MDRFPALVCSDMSRELRSEFDQVRVCQLIWAPDDELYFSTGKGVLGGQIVIEGNLGVMMICGGHSVIFRTYGVISSAEPFAKGFSFATNQDNWSTGVLEYWSAGVLECWSAGVLESSSFFINCR